MTTFGPLIKALRLAANLTLDDVAKKIGSHKGYVCGIEREKVNAPSVAVVRKFHRLFAPTLVKLGIQSTEEDLVELAWVSKAPALIRRRALSRLTDNPVAGLLITKPAEPPPTIKRAPIGEAG